jgi:hypothetical protein
MQGWYPSARPSPRVIKPNLRLIPEPTYNVGGAGAGAAGASRIGPGCRSRPPSPGGLEGGGAAAAEEEAAGAAPSMGGPRAGGSSLGGGGQQGRGRS